MSKWLEAAGLSTEGQKGHIRQKVTEAPEMVSKTAHQDLLSPSVPSVTVSKGEIAGAGRDNILAGIKTLLAGRSEHELTTARRVVTDFLERHMDTARHIGWTEPELFGCHPNPKAARIRFDYMGAVTLAAVSGQFIERITERAAHYAGGLIYYRRDMPDGTAAMTDQMLVQDDKNHQHISKTD